MRVVVKAGGAACADRALRRELARQIAKLAHRGHRLVLVHGGGTLLTQTLARLGIPTRFHNGLRITDAATRDAALMVLAGAVNKYWVADLETQGQPALGICGGDAGLVTARRLSSSAEGSRGPDLANLGFVGRPGKVDTGILEVAFERGLVPVVATLARDAEGEYLNINSDDFAAAIAAALGADRLLYLTESGGVRDADRRLLPLVGLNEIRNLVRNGTAREGMIPKLQSCTRAIRRGVGEVDVVSAAIPNGLIRAIEKGEPLGTRIIKSGDANGETRKRPALRRPADNGSASTARVPGLVCVQ